MWRKRAPPEGGFLTKEMDDTEDTDGELFMSDERAS